MFTPEEMESIPEAIAKIFKQLEKDVINDILKRMQSSKNIISSTDYQLWMINQLGSHKKAVKKLIKNALDLSDAEIDKIYDEAIKQSYIRDEALYKATGADYVPFDENKSLKQLIEGIKLQTKEEFKNITATTGFVINNKVHTDLYKDIMDKTLVEISTGVFDYNKALKKAITDMTGSGLRWIDYASGHHNRVDVAVRRAVMTGVHQVTSEITKQNAEKLQTDLYEVSWHSTARPEHQKWQGRVYTMQQLIDVCGLGTGPGLCGWNCYHFYDPFIEGVSVRKYTDEWLDEQNKKANEKRKYGDKEYTTYEATQRQRALETRMRAYKERIDYAEKFKLDKSSYQSDLIKYNDTMKEYKDFSEKMGLPFQPERIHTGRSDLKAKNTDGSIVSLIDDNTYIQDVTTSFMAKYGGSCNTYKYDCSKNEFRIADSHWEEDERIAQILSKNFNHEVTLRKPLSIPGIYDPDCIWIDDKIWEFKTVSGFSGYGKRIRKGLLQIAEGSLKNDPGGIIIDITELLKNNDYEKIYRTALNIMKTHADFEYYIMFIVNEHIKEILKLGK